MVTQAVLSLPMAALVALFLVFVFGGVVKGVTGVGLPLVLVPLVRISHRDRCIGAPFLRKSCWLNGLSQGQGESRCGQSVARRCSNLHVSKGA
jgi:hypothetical protein